MRRGRAEVALEKLVRETGADAIYFNRDPDPNGRAIEVRLAKMTSRRRNSASHRRRAALARGYPLPMIDHHRERDAALEMFRR